MAEMEQDARKSLLLRLRKIEGQVRGVQRMIEDQAECGEILNQVTAVKSAITQVGILVFQNHARECIVKAMSEENKEENFKEIVDMMGRLIK